MSVTKDSFRDWKANPVTKAVLRDIQNRVIGLQLELGSSAGLEPLQDRFKVGAIAAYNDLLDIDFEDTKSD